MLTLSSDTVEQYDSKITQNEILLTYMNSILILS
jgi:hypothetical protein